MITFRLLDGDGKQLGNAIVVGDNITPGYSWDFQRAVLDDAAVTYILIDINGD